MGFLLGAFGKLAAGRRVRALQARMMRVQTKMRRATRQIEQVSKMLETQKKLELNSLTYMQMGAGSMFPKFIQQELMKGMSDETLAKFMGMGGVTVNTYDPKETQQYGEFQMHMSSLKAQNEMYIASMKSQIEEKYENLNDMMLEPLKMEEDSLQTEKDSLESQIQIAQADYDACKKLEQSEAKNLAPNYTGQA